MNRKTSGDNTGWPEKGQPPWLITFADLSTLLLAFFVLLLSMTSVDDRSLKSMFSNFTSACGILYFKDLGETYRHREVLIDGIYQKLQDALIVKRAGDPAKDLVAESKDANEKELENSLVIREFKEGFKMVFGHQILFSSGTAEVKEEMKPVLEKVALFMKATAYQIYIDGHTDDTPLRSAEFATNEDLSLARAYNVFEYFVKEGKVLPGSLALGGYGELLPVASNDTPLGRGNNRRVEIIFKNQTFY